VAREDDQVLEHVEVLVEIVGLGDHSQPLAHLAPRAVGIEAEHFKAARVAAQAAVEHPHGRRLAGAVGTEEAEADAIAYLEVDGIDGSTIAVDLDQALGHDGRRERGGEVGQCCSGSGIHLALTAGQPELEEADRGTE
jgi:hypothetical protein